MSTCPPNSECRFKPKCWGQAIRSSLSLKLIAIFIGGSIGLAMLLGSLSEYGLKRHFINTVRPLLTHYQHYLAEEVGSPPSIQRAEKLTNEWPLTIRIFDGTQIWASDGRLIEPSQHEREWGEQHDQPQNLDLYWDRGVVFLKQELAEASVYFGLRLRPSGAPWFPLMLIGLVLLGLVGFYLLTRRLFKPIQTIQTGITRIGAGQLDHRIELCRTDELGQLAKEVNKMADDLQQMMQAKRDLLLALSHELKSPLARSRVTLALLEDSPQQQALLDDQLAMQQLIDEIIEAERGHSDHAVSHRESTLINPLVEEVINRFDPKPEIQLALCPVETRVNIDRSQIKRLLRNLLENALRYNRPERGSVKVACETTSENLILTVSDHGIGIDQPHLDRVTEAFYRADPSRERKTGGLGLGLYLCQAVVKAHQGEMHIHSEVGVGTRVQCTIPLNIDS
ncbi:MAG: HAMP domain-containing histidine kinase [Gammaproteobacteria bacterium]|nr:HAMP domain-containing histidine kinase [Gammaproteobacteria bacterium]